MAKSTGVDNRGVVRMKDRRNDGRVPGLCYFGMLCSPALSVGNVYRQRGVAIVNDQTGDDDPWLFC